MYIECCKNNGIDYLRLVESHRVTNSKGVKTATKKHILSIGPLSRFDDGKPDYVERLKKSFKAGNPLIPELLPYCSADVPAETYSVAIKEGSPDCFGHPRLFSHLFLERILEELGLNAFFSAYKAFTKLQYDVYGFARLLIFGRLLNPASKCATVRQNHDYYEPILSDGFNPDNVYDTLDFISENKDKIIRRINTSLVKKAGRSPEIIYYDVTNFYYEIGDPDDDGLDGEGNVTEKGIRKLGVCKEERKLPIVQMGLFMDDGGIPIAIEAFPGNTLDHLTLRPALKKTIDGLDFSRFILIADRGICNYMNLLHVTDAGNGYIVSKSLLKSTKKEQAWTYSDEDYISVGEDFKYKSRIIKRTVKDENGASRTLEEKVVVYWSRKFQQRSEKENNNLSMGYYQIVTSELKMDAFEVIDKYHDLTQIEDQFRVMKGDLDTRPLFVWKKEHIEAHLLICTIALIMLRIIQQRILKSGQVPTTPDAYWSTGLSGSRIQAALNKWKVDLLPGDLYRFMDVDDPDLKLILDAFGIKIPVKLYRRAELKSLKTGTEIFI